MHPPQYVDAFVPAADTEPCRALVERIKASSELNRSPRLRQLFEYLCAQSLAAPGLPVSEERIGIEVFGRPVGYDTGADTIVRVQVSQLRRKLDHYFLSEGLAEPVIVELPKRSYTPVFRLREQPAIEAAPWTWRSRRVVVTILAAACLVVGGWFWKAASAGIGASPYRNHFWGQLVRYGRQTQIVTSDANAMVLADFLGRLVTPAEYVGSGYPAALIDAEVADAGTRKVLKSITTNFVTNMPDLRVSNQFSQVAASMGGRFNVVYARDFRYQPQAPDNLILLSHRKANPWVTLFEDRLNFTYEFDARNNKAALVNRRPRPGESERYPVDWGVQTYALIAHLRKPVGDGSVLLVGGADTIAPEAGCNLLTDEARLKSLYERLGLRLGGTIPEFEVLLRAKLLRGFVRDYEIVAHRVISR